MFSAKAQKTCFLEFQTDIATVKESKPSLEFKGGILKNIDNNIRFGAGLGLEESSEFNAAPSIPLFLRTECMITNSGNCIPYIDLDLGYKLNLENFNQGGIFINPVLGLRFNKYSIAFGYEGFTSFAKNSEWGNAISIRLGYNFPYKSSGRRWKDTAMYRFFKKTTFGLDVSIGTGLGEVETKDSYLTYSYSGLTTESFGFHWVYNFNEHWAAGIGAQMTRDTYTEKIDEYNQTQDYDEFDATFFCRVEYTHDEIADNIKPYGNIDLGYGVSGVYLAPQVGIKYKDKYRLGVSFNNRSKRYNKEGTCSSLNLNLGIDF